MASNLIGNEAPLSGVASSNLVSSAFAIVWDLSNSKRFFYDFSLSLLDFFSFSCYHINKEIYRNAVASPYYINVCFEKP